MDTSSAFPTLRVVSHPLVQHKLTILRDRATPTKIFKELVSEIAMLMAYEATSDIPLEDATVDTPLESTVGKQLSGKKLTLVPILRAGLGMVEGIDRLVPNARIDVRIAGDHRQPAGDCRSLWKACGFIDLRGGRGEQEAPW